MSSKGGSREIRQELDAIIQETDNGSLGQSSSSREDMNQFQDVPGGGTQKVLSTDWIWGLWGKKSQGPE